MRQSTPAASNQAELPGKPVKTLAIQLRMRDLAVTSITRQRCTAPESVSHSTSVGTDDNSMRDSRI